MTIKTIYANMSCSHLQSSEDWYSKLLGTKAGEHPMPGLAEWHRSDSAVIQLFEQKDHAGFNTLTLGVSDVQEERSRLTEIGLSPGEVEEVNQFKIFRLRDPDQNLVVVAGPK